MLDGKKGLNSPESYKPIQVKIIPRRVEKHYFWYCERCRTQWTYDRNLNIEENWTAFRTHINRNGERCYSRPINKLINESSLYTDVRVLLRDQ